jgi:ATP-dependent Zn protease
MTNMAQQHCTRPWWLRPPVWILGAIVVLAAVFVAIEIPSTPAAIPYGTFLDQIDAGNIASVTFQGTQIDGRFKHPLNNAASKGAAAADVFRSHVPDFGDPALIAELRAQHVVINVVTATSWTRLLGAVPLPMLLFVGLALIAGLVRLARGGKAQSGSAMPMHPMQGMVGVVSGLFSKPRQADSPPAQDSDKPKTG